MAPCLLGEINYVLLIATSLESCTNFLVSCQKMCYNSAINKRGGIGYGEHRYTKTAQKDLKT